MENNVLGFLGLGTVGFPMCYNLLKNGHFLVLPVFRMEIDTNSGFSPLVPDYQSKLAVYNEIVKSWGKGGLQVRRTGYK